MPAVDKLHLLCMSHCHVPVCPCELVLPDLLARTPCRDETLLLSFKETHSGPVPPPPRHHPPPITFLICHCNGCSDCIRGSARVTTWAPPRVRVYTRSGPVQLGRIQSQKMKARSPAPASSSLFRSVPLISDVPAPLFKYRRRVAGRAAPEPRDWCRGVSDRAPFPSFSAPTGCR